MEPAKNHSLPPMKRIFNDTVTTFKYVGGRPRQSLAEVVWNICFSGCLTWPGPLLSPPIAHPPSTFHLSTSTRSTLTFHPPSLHILHPLYNFHPLILHPLCTVHLQCLRGRREWHVNLQSKWRPGAFYTRKHNDFSGVSGGLRRGCTLIRNRDGERWRGGEPEA